VAPSSATTDTNGFVSIAVYYPEEYAYYAEVTLKAQTQVQCTNFQQPRTVLLEGAAADFKVSNGGPPGPFSPWGQSNTCKDAK
jgi:hypothetical protein